MFLKVSSIISAKREFFSPFFCVFSIFVASNFHQVFCSNSNRIASSLCRSHFHKKNLIKNSFQMTKLTTFWHFKRDSRLTIDAKVIITKFKEKWTNWQLQKAIKIWLKTANLVISKFAAVISFKSRLAVTFQPVFQLLSMTRAIKLKIEGKKINWTRKQQAINIKVMDLGYENRKCFSMAWNLIKSKLRKIYTFSIPLSLFLQPIFYVLMYKSLHSLSQWFLWKVHIFNEVLTITFSAF
jgi:hypothetical protein